MSTEKITFEDIALGAIVEGFQGGVQMFMEGLEDALRKDVLIQEAGGVDEIIAKTIEEASTPSYDELAAKLASVVG